MSARQTLVAILLVTVASFASVSTALAGWFFNAQYAVEGADVRTQWSITDAESADGVRAVIQLWVPENADAALIATTTDQETATLHRSEDLSCSADGVEVVGRVLVLANAQASGSQVAFTLRADGTAIGTASGGLREWLTIEAVVPVVAPACAAEG